MGVRSECGFCENNGPKSRGIAFFRGGVFGALSMYVWVKYPPMAAVPNYPNNGPQRSRQSAGPGGA